MMMMTLPGHAAVVGLHVELCLDPRVLCRPSLHLRIMSLTVKYRPHNLYSLNELQRQKSINSFLSITMDDGSLIVLGDDDAAFEDFDRFSIFVF